MSKKICSISEQADFDMDDIYHYTLMKWSKEQADRYYNLILDEIDYICIAPNSGKQITHVKRAYNVSKVKSHLIYYRLNETDVIEIIRILHEKMDIGNKLEDWFF